MRQRGNTRRVMAPVTIPKIISLANAQTYKPSPETWSMPSTPTVSSIASLIDADLPSSPFPPHQKRRRMSSAAVDSVLSACRLVDCDATLASATYCSEGNTRVAIRSGVYGSVQHLREALETTVPLANVTLNENMLDGTLELIVTVPTSNEEKRRAKTLVAKLAVPRLLRMVAIVLICSSFGSALADIVSVIPAPPLPVLVPTTETAPAGAVPASDKEEL